MLIDLQLFWEFFKTGLFSVGGGLATLPFLQDIGRKTGWFTTADVSNMIAVSESTPGPLGINMATYVGYKTVGLEGGIVATLGLVCPAIITIILISKILDRFRDSQIVQRVFYGLRPASTGLIAAAGLGVAELSLLHMDVFRATGSVADLFNWPLILLAVLIYIGIKKFNRHPVLYIAVAAVCGIVFRL